MTKTFDPLAPLFQRIDDVRPASTTYFETLTRARKMPLSELHPTARNMRRELDKLTALSHTLLGSNYSMWPQAALNALQSISDMIWAIWNAIDEKEMA